MNRRSFMKGILLTFTAPAIIRAENLMKIVVPKIIIPTASQTFRQGDVFTVAGYYAFNPGTNKRLSHLQQFVVKSDLMTDKINQKYGEIIRIGNF